MPLREISDSATSAFLDNLKAKDLDSQDFWIDISAECVSEIGYSDSAMHNLLLRLQALADRKRIDIFIWCLTREEVDLVSMGRQTPLNKVTYLRD